MMYLPPWMLYLLRKPLFLSGRASEGCDFRDFAARAVIVVGVPYPSLNTETKLIIKHRDAVAGKGAGDLWYEAEAYRTLSIC